MKFISTNQIRLGLIASLLLGVAACGRTETRLERYPDGKLMAEQVTQGNRSVTKAYLPDGTLISEKHYRQGELHGVTRIYRNDGSLFQEIRYRRGEEVSRKEFLER